MPRKFLLLGLIAIATLAAVACGSSEPEFDPATFDPFTTLPVELDVLSPEIRAGEMIPVRFTCDGENKAPVFSWQRPPNGTQAMAIVMDDPDTPGGIFAHWVAFNLDPDDTSVRRLIEGKASESAVQGVNDFGENGYGGPCPPQGETHEYRISVFALIAPIALDEDADAQDVLTAMRGSVIGHGVLSAQYARQ